MLRVEIISEKGTGLINEDSFVALNNTFGVFDGAASIVKYRDNFNKTGGYLASNIAAKELGNENQSLFNLARGANEKLKLRMLEAGIDISKGVNRWSTTIAAVKIEDGKFDWVHIGDSVIIVIEKSSSFRIISPYHNHDVEVLQLVKSFSGKEIGNLWEYPPFLEASIKLQNNRNITYGVLDGSEDAEKFINKGSENLENIKHILLLTDGCFIPQENPDGNEDFDAIVKIILKEGGTGLLNYIRQLQKNDPKLWKYPRFKQSDDFTCINLEFN